MGTKIVAKTCVSGINSIDLPADATQGLDVEIGRLWGKHVVRVENMMPREIQATDAAPM